MLSEVFFTLLLIIIIIIIIIKQKINKKIEVVEYNELLTI